MTLPRFLHPFAPPGARDFLSIVEGRGALVWDADGRSYVDALASLWYCNAGHGREAIADAVSAQLRTLAAFHTFDRYTNPPADELAEVLSDLAPMPDARVFFTSSGSEAVDSAIKLARQSHSRAGRPERRVIVSRRPSYHGVTYGAMAATGLPDNHDGFGSLLPDMVQVPRDDLAAVAEVFATRPGEVAAVIAEPVIGGGGVYPPAPGYLEGLRRLCDEHGAWLILDEVICGFGRLGAWWGAQYFGVRPDLVTFAKGVTSGYVPLGGVLVGPAVREPLEEDPDFMLRHGHTFSGHPAACSAALANIRLIEEESLLERAVKVGARLGSGLRALADEGLVAEARGDGAIWAVEMPEGVDVLQVRDGLLERGVIARPIGAALAFCPPLVITDSEIDQCVEALAGALRADRHS